MDFPIDESFIKEYIKARVVFVISTASNPNPHPYICLGVKGDEFLLCACCTSQIAKTYDRISKGFFEERDVVIINPNEIFPKETAVYCHQVEYITFSEILQSKRLNGTFSLQGGGERISSDHYEQILLSAYESKRTKRTIKPHLDELIGILYE